MCNFTNPNSGSIYPVPITTTTPATTTTAPVESDEATQKPNKKDKGDISVKDGNDDKVAKSLKAEMKGFLEIITKFTDLTSLPVENHIGQRDFSIRAVSIN